jgi:prevent-host-death family protein
MITITAAELQKQFGRYRDAALTEPVSITHHGRDSIVMMSADEYKRLKALDIEMNTEKEKIMDAEIAKHLPTLQKLALR